MKLLRTTKVFLTLVAATALAVILATRSGPAFAATAKDSKGKATMTKPTSSLPPTDFAAEAHPGREIAVLAGGCFWGMEGIIRDIPGVVDTQVGYTGGNVSKPTYPDVKTGSTGHAEAIQIIFDPKKLSFEDLLSWFFRMHDPTTMNRQGNDRGTQYRSGIFIYNDAQKASATKIKDKVDKSGKWKAPAVTEITQAGPFWRAEEYHQHYLQKNPGGYTCHFLRD